MFVYYGKNGKNVNKNRDCAGKLAGKLKTETNEHDHQALLEAKYCPRVTAASCAQRNTKT